MKPNPNNTFLQAVVRSLQSPNSLVQAPCMQNIFQRTHKATQLLKIYLQADMCGVEWNAMAMWLKHWSWDHEVTGSNPGPDSNFLSLHHTSLRIISGG